MHHAKRGSLSDSRHCLDCRTRSNSGMSCALAGSLIVIQQGKGSAGMKHVVIFPSTLLLRRRPAHETTSPHSTSQSLCHHLLTAQTAPTAAVSAAAEGEIHAAINAQTEAWNRADIPAFMQAYEDSPDTTFIGSPCAKAISRSANVTCGTTPTPNRWESLLSATSTSACSLPVAANLKSHSSPEIPPGAHRQWRRQKR